MPRLRPSGTPLPRPRLGGPAPEITLLDTEGDDWRLSDHRGRAVVIVFHRHIH